MAAAPDLAARPIAEPWRTSHAPPRVELTPLTGRELDAWFRGGEPEADACEALLAWAARARGALDVAIAEALDALRQGERLAELGCHLDDYAREVLDLGKRAAEGLAQLGRELRARPLLREALRSGRVRLRAAQTALKVAVGEEEAAWVERAARMTVRELEAEVRRAGTGSDDGDERWLRLGAHLEPDERGALDEALALAGELMPGATRAERLEAIAQEYAGEYAGEADPDPARVLGTAVRPLRAGDEARAAALEQETERWAALPCIADVPAPDVRFYETATAQDVDGRLRELAALRSEWEDLVGYCALAVRTAARGIARSRAAATARPTRTTSCSARTVAATSSPTRSAPAPSTTSAASTAGTCASWAGRPTRCGGSWAGGRGAGRGRQCWSAGSGFASARRVTSA